MKIKERDEMQNRLFNIILLMIVMAGGRVCADELWHSKLYPLNWQPGFKDKKGRYLQDYSYAGYHNGKVPLSLLNNTVFIDVVNDFKADNSGTADASVAIQQAIHEAEKKGGGVVYLPEGIYRCDSFLTISKSTVIIVGAGAYKTKIYFLRNVKDKANITFAGTVSIKHEVPLENDVEPFQTTLKLTHVKGLAKGMDIQIGIVISKEFCQEHGMADYWTVARNKWRPFFRRSIIDINPKTREVTIDVPIRYKLNVRDKLSLKVVTGLITECGLKNLAVANACKWESAWQTNNAHLIAIKDAKDCWLDNVRSFEPPTSQPKGYHIQSGGIVIQNSKRITLDRCTMQFAQNRGPGGNGCLFELSQACDVLVKDCTASHGQHNFIQRWDFNTNGCVFLRVKSSEGKKYIGRWDPLGVTASSGFSHSLSMANLVDSAVVDDGWTAFNRLEEESNAGHTSTQNVFWNVRGKGTIHSAQYGWGYIIGTGREIRITTSDGLIIKGHSKPIDFVEGQGRAVTLRPISLYEDQLKRRLKTGGK